MSKIETPCTNKCKLVHGICIGCNRTKEHIINWINYSEEQRKYIMKSIK